MKRLAPYFVLLAGILWGTMGIYVRRLNAVEFTTIEIVALRSVVTAIMLMPVLFFYDKTMLRVYLKDFWCFVGTGILSIVFLISVTSRQSPSHPYRWQQSFYIRHLPL